ncbi:MAG TPA: glycosyltransferase [Anaerolineae bacterium]|nr:glycosyltransferase [Anaerolineae bacterium]
MTRSLRVCYFGTYRAEYSRNRIMIEGLRRNGVEVIECHETLWQGIDDRVKVAGGGWKHFAFLIRVLKTYARLLWQYRQVGAYDVLVVGYPGQLDVFLARVLAWLRRKPLVWDVFMSIYLIAWERGLAQKGRLNLWLLRTLEYFACRLPDLLIQDTDEYVKWLCRTHHLKAERFRLVPTGADDRIFYPVMVATSDSRIFRVLYYGTFIPNHGVSYIIETARCLLDDPDIQFELIGDGPEKARALELAQQYQLTNVIFTDWIPQAELTRHIATANVCLGAFGDTPQSLMTVQNKIYECMALGKVVITGDSPAVQTTLRAGQHLFVCRRDDPHALVILLQQLKVEPQTVLRVANGGYTLYWSTYDLQHNGLTYLGHLLSLIRTRKREWSLP